MPAALDICLDGQAMWVTFRSSPREGLKDAVNSFLAHLIAASYAWGGTDPCAIVIDTRGVPKAFLAHLGSLAKIYDDFQASLQRNHVTHSVVILESDWLRGAVNTALGFSAKTVTEVKFVADDYEAAKIVRAAFAHHTATEAEGSAALVAR